MLKKHKGFTLIEILIALMIFAIVGVMAAMSLQSMIRTHKRLAKADAQLLQLQITMTLLRRDMMNMINRPIRDTDGYSAPAFSATSLNSIVFTRTGLSNPFGVSQQSNMQRVGYTLDGNKFVRLTWNSLDEPPKENPEKQVLLNDVKSLQWQFITDNNQTSSVWPPTTGSRMQEENAPLPKAVLLVLYFNNNEVIQGVFPIAARGANVLQNATASS